MISSRYVSVVYMYMHFTLKIMFSLAKIYTLVKVSLSIIEGIILILLHS